MGYEQSSPYNDGVPLLPERFPVSQTRRPCKDSAAIRLADRDLSSCSGLRQKLAIQRVGDWDRGDAKRVVKPDLVLTREADPRAYNTSTP